MLNAYQSRVVALLTNYSSVIVAGFHGHTHKDNIQVFYANYSDPNSALFHSFIMSSVTPNGTCGLGVACPPACSPEC